MVAQLQIRAIDIGLVPEAGPDRIGAVGVPVWMWVDNPSSNTIGPLTDSQTAQGVRVTVTAKLDEVSWNMGDGNTVHCTGTRAHGTPYLDSYGMAMSPTCGYKYQKQGAPYTITATSHWSVDWSGGGLSGTIPITVARSTTRNIGELQAVTVR